MAKKKEKKDSKKKFEYSNEIIGILVVLISIIGIGNYGPVGHFISSFAVFLVGSLYIVLLLFLLVFGFILIAKKEMPSTITARQIGIGIVFLSILIFLHTQYIFVSETEGINIITETFDNLLLAFKSESAIGNSGGGIIGAIFSFLFVTAFKDGTYIVVITMALLGIILIFNVSLFDQYSKYKDKIKQKIESRRNEEDDEDLDDDKVVENVSKDKVIISSMRELNHSNIEEDSNDIPIAKEGANTAVNQEVVEKNVNYKLPPLSLLKTVKNTSDKDNVNATKENISKLEKVLADFDVPGHIVECHIGPTVTQYELDLKAGTKVSRLLNIQKEMTLALAAKDIRIQAPIPGKTTIGIELPNKVNASVSFKEVLTHLPDVNSKTLLAVGLGKDIMGSVKWAEINATPHLLVAGATGSGKSVCINCIIASILMRAKPDEVKLVMVDPKKVELSNYNGIPHLKAPVVTDPKKASIALKNIVIEMENRYDIFEKTKCKNIRGYNDFCEKNPEYEKMPYIVVIIDELADLMLVAAKDVEDSIMRITQMARAAGIHLIVATQRPSTDVITGVVKANIPSRISFAVSSQIDSRTILDSGGAEKLLGKGDMLFLPMGESSPIRIQGAYVSDEEIEKIVNYVIDQQKAQYDESLTVEQGGSSVSNDGYESADEYDDPLYNEIVDFAIQTGKISASFIQRKYHLGFNRAARIIDLLEERGVVGPQNGSKPREVLIKKEDVEE